MVEENFYFDLLSKRADEPWKTLIDGGAYSFEDREYFFQGISGVLAYFTYARFKLNSSAVSSSHGFVVKTTPDSTPLSLEERRNEYYEKQRQANLLFEDVKKFIQRNISDYPSWYNSNSCEKRPTGPSKTRVIQ